MHSPSSSSVFTQVVLFNYSLDLLLQISCIWFNNNSSQMIFLLFEQFVFVIQKYGKFPQTKFPWHRAHECNTHTYIRTHIFPGVGTEHCYYYCYYSSVPVSVGIFYALLNLASFVFVHTLSTRMFDIKK